MADFSKLNFFSRMDARARVLLLFGVVVVIVLGIYFGASYLGGGEGALGPTRVANVPAGLQSVPGSKSVTAEYQRTLVQANAQAAEAAKMSGQSAIPTQINTSFGPGSCVICSDNNANVKNLLDQWVREGKVNPDVAGMLNDLAAKNVSVDEYADALDKLVKDGKLTPAQARELLDEYKKQHANALLNDSEKAMDAMIKSGDLPLDVANQLLDAQRRGVSPAEYANLLQQMVKDGKISPETAKKLLKQYNDQRMQEALKKQVAAINKMAENGAINPDVAKTLVALTEKNVPVDEYARQLNALVKQGKITPANAAKLLEGYRALKSGNSSLGTIDALLQKAENEAYQEISDLLSAGKITPDVAAQLTSMIQNDVTTDQFKLAIASMVEKKQITPDIAQLKINDYVKVKQYRDAKKQLEDLQANNASPADYAAALKRMVAAGLITPDQAEQLLRDYQNLSAAPSAPIAGGAFGALQQKVATPNTPAIAPGEFAAAQTQVAVETAEQRQARLTAVMNAMNGQAGQLISTWQPTTVMTHKEGTPETKTAVLTTGTGEGAAGTATTTTTTTTTSGTPSLIKGGTIYFAVLDTAINSDYPDTPVMATIVEGKYKGATVLGKIITTKGVTGQMDRVSLNFTMMNVDDWPKSRTITAYGIDPDTARTAIASTVDYHWMMRFGAIMATSFLQGYSTAITNEGTSTTGIFGTSTTHPALSSGNKIMVGLGQVGQTLGNATQNYINRPPTVRVDSGVSLGILFMNDVTS